ncbi:MAG: hypothetical protein V7723_09500 [Sneathiella sp.]|uniref:hypothetical protein n=1 Tax=Sneathiella sp. TaxID=1964365 RepID=UPI003002F173
MKFLVAHRFGLFSVFCVLFTSACDQRTEEDIITGAAGLTTPSAVQAAIGSADNVSSLGNTEIWKYGTSSRDICFIVAGDTIMQFSCAE